MRLTGIGVAMGLALGVSSLTMAGHAALAQQADATVPAAHDFSGVWTTYRPPGEAFAITRGGERPEPPFTPEGKRRWDEYKALQGVTGDGPAAHCVPYGMPTMMQSAGGYPIEFILRPEQLTIIYEVESETRRVYLGGRSVPPEKRLPVRQGYSEGRWDGDTLVVTTTDLSDGFDQSSLPHSEEAVLTETFRMVPDEAVGSILEDTLSMTDPVYYTEPVGFEKRWMPLKDGYMLAYNCSEEYWLALMDARRAQLEAGEPVTAKMSDVVDIFE